MPHRFAIRPSAVLVLGMLLVPGVAAAWVVRSAGADGSGVAARVLLAPDGNPVVAGTLIDPPPADGEAHVAKHSASDGSELWTYTSGGNGNDFANGLAIDSAGGVFVLIARFRGADVYDASVVKLSGTDGTELWHRDFGGPGYQDASSIAIASDGDAIVAMSDGPIPTVGSVTRFDGATGATVWSAPFVGVDGDGRANAVALDAAGDVAVVGDASDGTHGTLLVVKLDGATGAELWRSGLDVTNGSNGYAVAIDGVGNVVAAGQNMRLHPPDDIYNDQFPFVAKFAGADGAQLWAHDDLTGAPDDLGLFAAGLAIDAGDDVYATGLGRSAMLALRLEGDTGLVTWRRDVTGIISDIKEPEGLGEGVTVHPSGAPVFFGELGNRFTAIALDPATGDTLWLQDLPGDNNNAGRIFGLVLDPGGYVFAAGYSTFPLIPNQGNQTNEYTVVRWVDPLSPPAAVGDCTPAPHAGCRAAPARKSILQMKDVAFIKGDLLKWKWTAADATTALDYGDPLAEGNDFSLCVYDGTSAQIFGAVVPGDGGCGPKGVACWRARGDGRFSYKAAARDVDGVNALSLRAGPALKGRIVLKRKGRPLGDLPLPNLSALDLPLTVQLQRGGGACFGATFSTPETSDATRFSARSD